MGTATSEEARRFARDQGLEVTVLVDPDRVAFRAAGLRRGLRTLANLDAARAAARALGAGFRQGSTQGDVQQQGGVFVVLPGGGVAFAHVSAFAGDHPPEEAVLGALRQAIAPAAASARTL